jgi:hypothetical protein
MFPLNSFLLIILVCGLFGAGFSSAHVDETFDRKGVLVVFVVSMILMFKLYGGKGTTK